MNFGIRLLVVFAIVVLLIPHTALGQESEVAWEHSSQELKVSGDVQEMVAAVVAEEGDQEEEKVGRLSRRRKRELGLLPHQVIRNVVSMAKQDLITKDMSPQEMAFAYTAHVSQAEPYKAAWSAVEGPDWEAILEFIEGLMELLVKFLPMIL